VIVKTKAKVGEETIDHTRYDFYYINVIVDNSTDLEKVQMYK